ncbi:hypothetical protein ACKVEX_16445 [Rhodocyclaceae bacterium SMB388]
MSAGKNRGLSPIAPDSLRRALVVWLNRVVLKRLMPGERLDEVFSEG